MGRSWPTPGPVDETSQLCGESCESEPYDDAYTSVYKCKSMLNVSISNGLCYQVVPSQMLGCGGRRRCGDFIEIDL